MTTAAASTPSIAAITASPPLAFRKDAADASFPMAGAALLMALIVVAAWAWLFARLRGGATHRLSWLRRLAPAIAPGRGDASIRIVDQARVDAHTRLYVVEWRQRRYLLAVAGTSAPVVVDREGTLDAIGGAP